MTEARRAFGEKLRRQREQIPLTLEVVAQTTKVAASLFAGLERGDCRRWPSGIYSRAFIRSYAETIQLDPDVVAAEFAALYEPAPIKPTEAPPEPADSLRLTLDWSADDWWPFAARAAQAGADTVVVLTLAMVLSLVAGHFWICATIVSLAWHGATRVLGGASPLDVVRSLGRPAAPADPADEQSPALLVADS